MQEEDGLMRVNGVSTMSETSATTDAAIYDRHRDELIRYATALVGSDEAEDVLSAVVLRVLNRRSLTDISEPRAYLFRAVLNECRSRGRRRLLLPLTSDLPVPDADDHRPELADAVRSLPARQRAATFFVYWMGCSIAQTAELMGTKPGTVARYLHLARRRLRSYLDDRQD